MISTFVTPPRKKCRRCFGVRLSFIFLIICGRLRFLNYMVRAIDDYDKVCAEIAERWSRMLASIWSVSLFRILVHIICANVNAQQVLCTVPILLTIGFFQLSEKISQLNDGDGGQTQGDVSQHQ